MVISPGSLFSDPLNASLLPSPARALSVRHSGDRESSSLSITVSLHPPANAPGVRPCLCRSALAARPTGTRWTRCRAPAPCRRPRPPPRAPAAPPRRSTTPSGYRCATQSGHRRGAGGEGGKVRVSGGSHRVSRILLPRLPQLVFLRIWQGNIGSCSLNPEAVAPCCAQETESSDNSRALALYQPSDPPKESNRWPAPSV
jgi:hypothetical protein